MIGRYWAKFLGWKRGAQPMSVLEQLESRTLMSVLAYEGFDYAAGSLANAAGGSGWATGSGWGGASTASVVSGSLASVSSPANNMPTTGNSASVSWQQTATRNLPDSLISTGDTLWVSFILNSVNPPDNYMASVMLTSESGPLWLGTPYGGKCSFNTPQNWVRTQDEAFASGTSHLIVAKIQYLNDTNSNGGNAIISEWVDPTTLGGSAPDSAAASLLDYNISTTISSPTSVGLCAGDIFYGSANFDEIRLGTTYSDVAPPATPIPAPTDLTASAISSGQIELTWTDNSSDETAFVIQRDTDSSFSNPTTVASDIAANTTTFSDTTAVDGTQYYYRIKAVGNGGSSTWSTSAQVTTPLATPTNLTLTEDDSTQVTLRWEDNSASETGYVIERSLYEDFSSVTTFTAASNATSYTDSSLAPDTGYFFRIRAAGPQGTYSEYSNDANIAKFEVVSWSYNSGTKKLTVTYKWSGVQGTKAAWINISKEGYETLRVAVACGPDQPTSRIIDYSAGTPDSVTGSI